MEAGWNGTNLRPSFDVLSLFLQGSRYPATPLSQCHSGKAMQTIDRLNTIIVRGRVLAMGGDAPSSPLDGLFSHKAVKQQLSRQRQKDLLRRLQVYRALIVAQARGFILKAQDEAYVIACV